MVFGTFDIFHEGHKNFLNQTKKHGDYLIAVIARNKTVLKIKGGLPKNSEQKRIDAMRKSGLVDKVILGSLTDKYAAIKKYQPDIICIGYDQNHFILEGLENFLRNEKLSHIKIIRLAPHKPEIYKSSLLH